MILVSCCNSSICDLTFLILQTSQVKQINTSDSGFSTPSLFVIAIIYYPLSVALNIYSFLSETDMNGVNL